MFPLKFYDAIAYGRLNDAAFRMVGNGTFDQANGRVSGLYEIEDLPPDIDSLIFNSILVTGYPSVCRAKRGVQNPFQFGDYSYRREITFETGEKIEYTAECSIVESKETLASTFIVGGSVPRSKLRFTELVSEVWSPISEGRIAGEFAIGWVRENGSILRGLAKSVYAPPLNAPILQRNCHREIRLTNSRPSLKQLTICQESELV